MNNPFVGYSIPKPVKGEHDETCLCNACFVKIMLEPVHRANEEEIRAV